jgi:hypothetical protein
VLRARTVTGSNVTDVEPPGSSLQRLGSGDDAIEVEGDRAAGHGAIAAVRQARGDRDTFLIRERGARERDRGDADVRLVLTAGDRQRGQNAALRQARAFLAAPAACAGSR